MDNGQEACGLWRRRQQAGVRGHLRHRKAVLSFGGRGIALASLPAVPDTPQKGPVND